MVHLSINEASTVASIDYILHTPIHLFTLLRHVLYMVGS
jgi:hypothetical protein